MSKGLGISPRFGFLIGILIAFAGVMMLAFFSRQERYDLDLRLHEKVEFINNFYAQIISQALQHKDDVILLQQINQLESDKEITLIVVVDKNSHVRYHPDPQKVGVVWDDPLMANALKTGDAVIAPFRNEGGRAIALVSPLKAQGLAEPIGAVRIELTFRQIEGVIANARIRFLPVVIGMFVFGIASAWTAARKWVVAPLHRVEGTVASINPLILEANLPESNDEFGRLYTALNDLVLRFKAEWQNQAASNTQQSEQEKQLSVRIVHALLPEARILIADKENRVLFDSEDSSRPAGRHLLDLITDGNFATLLNAAFQKEGDVARGPITFDAHSYEAAVVSFPERQTQSVKTVIALKTS